MKDRAGLTTLYIAFWLRFALVPASYFVPGLLSRLAGHADGVAHAIELFPLIATVLTLAGFWQLGRTEARSSVLAQLTAALMATEVLFDLVLLLAPARLADLPYLAYALEALRVAILLGSWSTLRALGEEEAHPVAVAQSALFYFAVAVRAGLYGARAYRGHTEPLDLHEVDAAAAVAIVASLGLPLLQAIAVGALRRRSSSSNGATS